MMRIGGASGFSPIQGTADLSRIEAPVTFKAYMLCAFAAFGGVCKSADAEGVGFLCSHDLAFSLWL